VNISNLNCRLNKNSYAYGGCLYLNNATYSIQDSSFIDNYARVGGAIYTFYSKYTVLKNNTFQRNEALRYGNDNATQPALAVLLNKTKPDISPYLLTYYNFTINPATVEGNTISYNLTNVSSAALNVTDFYIYLQDHFNHTINYIEERPLITPSYPVSLIQEENDSIVLVGTSIKLPEPNSMSSLILAINYLSTDLYLNISFTPRPCYIGEFFDPDSHQCQLCPPTFYSINTSIGCSECPSIHMQCRGGNIFDLERGYWLFPNTSELIACHDDGIKRCKGGLSLDSQCEQGYRGALCQACDYEQDYTLASGSVCIKCDDDVFMMVLKYLGVFLIGYLYELYFFYATVVSNSNFVKLFLMESDTTMERIEFKQKYYQGILMRLLTNFTQFSYIIFIYAQYSFLEIVGLVDQAQSYFSFISNPSTQQSSSLECLFLKFGIQPDEIPYFKMKYWLALPMLKLLLTVTILIIGKFKGRINRLKDKILIIIPILLLDEQLGLLVNLGRFCNCILPWVDDYGFMQLDTSIHCGDPNYDSFVREIIMPALGFWGIVVPLAIFVIIFRSRNKLDNPKTRIRYGGIINSYKPEAYYWNFVIMVFKLILLVSLIFIKTTSTAYLTGCIVIVAYYIIFNHMQPYSAPEFMEIERYSILTYMVTLFLMGYAGTNDDLVVLIGSGVIILITNLAMLFGILRKCFLGFLKARRERQRFAATQSDIVFDESVYEEFADTKRTISMALLAEE